MARHPKTQTIALHNGGTATITPTHNGGFTINTTRGYKETPAERLERIHNTPRANRIPSGKHKAPKGGRAAARRNARHDGWH